MTKPFDAPPVIVNFFYHKEIKKTHFLKGKLGKRKKAIKDLLHDQSVIAGIGNIYSDEILYGAGIYPEKEEAV